MCVMTFALFVITHITNGVAYMADRTFLPKTGARVKATQRKTYMTTCKVLLYKSDWTPDESSVLADYIAHEADFGGYVRASIAMDTIELLGATAYLLFSNVLATFQADGTAPPNDIGGMAILVQTAPGPPAVYDLGPVTTFDAPVPMGAADDTISRVASEVESN